MPPTPPPHPDDAPVEPALDAVILAAGRGKRMGGDQPKVLFEVADRPMIHWVVAACRAAGVRRCIVVIGFGGEAVRAALADEPSCVFVEQREQLGTAHATRMAEPMLRDAPGGDVLVLAGDGPLIRPETIAELVRVHREQQAAATLATAVLDDPRGYGRVIRGSGGGFEAIVEQKDASPEQLGVREVNPSYYCFRGADLLEGLAKVGNDNKQGEYYLTDVPGLLKRWGRTVAVVDAVPAQDVLSINTPEQLAEVDRVLRARLAGATAEEQAR